MISKEEFECMGVEISFIPFGNNPEDEVEGIAYTFEELGKIRELIGFKKISDSGGNDGN